MIEAECREDKSLQTLDITTSIAKFNKANLLLTVPQTRVIEDINRIIEVNRVCRRRVVELEFVPLLSFLSGLAADVEKRKHVGDKSMGRIASVILHESLFGQLVLLWNEFPDFKA